MKKPLKVLIAVFLIFALLAVGYWFFFHARLDLTTGLLTHGGDTLLEHGYGTAALRCYRWANALDSKNSTLALKLADAYRKLGNYTKTESVLVHAIYDAPDDSRLYQMLSQVYVEQDKLLDAQQMLDGIANEKVRAELTPRRPAAPVISPAGGYYRDYIHVEVSTADADVVCYCTMDGRYPTVRSDAYTEELVLPGGETTVQAIAVNAEGLVSSVVQTSYTVSGVVEPVHFSDDVLRQTVQELLNRGNRTIRTNDLWGIEELTLPEGLTDTKDLSLFTGLSKLVGRNLGDLDYSFLRDLPELRYLELDSCSVSTETLMQIGACSKLEVLILANCGLSKVEPLSTLAGIRILDLSDNSINSITPLTNLATLDELYLGHNALTALPTLRGLRSLRILDLSYNALDYVGSLSACATLERLNLAHNQLTSVSPVGALTELIWFNGSSNQVLDVSALSACTKLEGFVMTDNKLTNIDFLSACGGIQEVVIDYNDVEAVPEFQQDCPLETFSAAHNFLADLSGLAGLPKLSYVNADYNNIRDISVLKTCPALAQVNVFGTYITSGGVLADKGVVVNFKPDF